MILKCLPNLIYILAIQHLCFLTIVDCTVYYSLNDLTIINKFTGCTIRVTNFQGLDINGLALTEPIILLRYFSFHNDWLLYPYELSPIEPDKLVRKYSGKLLARFKKNRRIKIRNATTSFHYKVSNSYVNNILSQYPLYPNKNTNCEANIYLHPPNRKFNQYIYSAHHLLGHVLNDPFWFNFYFNYERERLKTQYLITRPKYSLLYCSLTENSICVSNRYRKSWITGILYSPDLVRTFERVLVLVKFSGRQNLYIFCPHCESCRPFKLVLVTKITFTSSRIVFEAKPSINNNYKYIVDVVLEISLPQYKNLVLHEQNSKKYILQQVGQLKASQAVLMKYVADVHRLLSVLPKNSTIRFFTARNGKHTILYNNDNEMCSGINNDDFHSRLRPSIVLNAQTNLGYIQEFGLIFRKSQFRFVSCHNKHAHWIYQLQDLVSVFDIFTWLVLLASWILISLMISVSLAYPLYRNTKTINNLLGGKITFYLFASMIDQSSVLFNNLKFRKNPAVYWSIVFIPLMSLILGNYYKGDNVTRLTLDAPLLPFDTFESLIKNNFTVYSRRIRLSKYATDGIKARYNTKGNYFPNMRHEDFPIVSELWHEVMLRRTMHEWQRLTSLGTVISKNIWWYLNNSRMFPEWLDRNGDRGAHENIIQVMTMHMDKCDKSAVILGSEFALRLYTVLSVKKKPVYLGKDIVSETFGGYKYFGYFPKLDYFRARYYFQSGITNWWETYFKWAIVLKTRSEGRKLLWVRRHSKTFPNQNKDHGATLALYVIPLTGYLSATIVFICFDSYIFESLAYVLNRMKYKCVINLKLCGIFL